MESPAEEAAPKSAESLIVTLSVKSRGGGARIYFNRRFWFCYIGLLVAAVTGCEQRPPTRSATEASAPMPLPANRYDAALALLGGYKFSPVRPEHGSGLGHGLASQKRGYLSDILADPRYSSKMDGVLSNLGKNEYAQMGNLYLLTTVLQSQLTDDKAFSEQGTVENVSWSSGHSSDNGIFYSYPNRLLHTAFGDFIIGVADQSRGNSVETNESASPLTIGVNLANGAVGASLEEKIVVQGEQKNLLVAALTLAASIDRATLQQDVQRWNHQSGGPSPLIKLVSEDLKAAKEGKLYQTSAPAPQRERDHTKPDLFANTTPIDRPRTSYTRSQFEEIIRGSNKMSVIAKFGRPIGVIPLDGEDEYTFSSGSSGPIVVVDDTTGIPIEAVGVDFDRAGNVISAHYL